MTTLQRSSATLLLLLVLVTQLLPTAHAAECSTTQIAAIRAFDANATAVCGESLLSTSAASVICARPECLTYIVSLESQVPYCDIAGVNVRTIFAFAGSYCAQQANGTDAVSATRSPSSAGASRYTHSGGALVMLATVVLAMALTIVS